MARLLPALAAAALLASLAGCTASAPAPTSTVIAPTATATVTRTATATATATTTRTAPAPSSSTRKDPNAPAGQCPDADLRVSIGGGDAGAGSIRSTVRFTNTGGTACSLAGFPGVSVVGDGNGTQLGAPADRAGTSVGAVPLPAGGSATATLTALNIDGAGGALGSKCPTKQGDGYRVYPPHSYRAFFVQAKGVLACTSTAVWMHVGAVGAR